MAAAVEMMLAAHRPVLFIGHGVTLSEAAAELKLDAAPHDDARLERS